MYSFEHSRSELNVVSRLRSINFVFLFLIIIIFLFGLLSLYSVSGGEFNSWPVKHLQRFLLGLIVFFIICSIDIKFFFILAYPIFLLNLLFLFIVPFFGTETYGATRWIKIGGISLQPSEFIKFTLILALAKYFHSNTDDTMAFIKKFILPLIIILIPVVVVAAQPDLGTAIVIFIGGVSIFWIIGLNYKYFITGGIMMILSIPLLWKYLKDYQKERVFTFFNPERDPLGNGYHIMQSKIALGSGGALGKGYLDGTQSHLNFLPEMHTDFIFTMFGEEFGFLGAFVLISIYAGLIFLSIKIGLESRSDFGKYLSLGVSTVFFIYVFVNISMVTGLLPVVGVPLPLVSYGGSSMLAVMGGFGLLMNCYIHQKTILPKGEIF
tara:strand:+ start:1708 stop:2847 length:1140 start_codon:yes stop_codon:yes gene_type:complete